MNANTPFFNTTIGLAMLIGRFFTMLPMLAVAGSLAMKKTVPAGAGTIPTATPLFMLLVVFVGVLSLVPGLALAGRVPRSRLVPLAVGGALAGSAGERDPVHARHHHVDEEHVGLPEGELLEAFDPVGGRPDREAVTLEHEPGRLPQGLVVLEQEHGRWGG